MRSNNLKVRGTDGKKMVAELFGKNKIRNNKAFLFQRITWASVFQRLFLFKTCSFIH